MVQRTRTFEALMKLITNPNYVYDYDDMMYKFDIFLMGNRITAEEYAILVDTLNAREEEKNPIE